MHRSFVSFAAITVSASAAASWYTPARAQTAPASLPAAPGSTVRLAARDAQTLADALRSFSNQANVAFVAEGTPFRATGSAPPLVTLAEQWPVNGLPLQEAVQKIANAYDYEAERKGDVFLLRKRYTNPNDLPEVTTEELRLALRDASRAASGLSTPEIAPTVANEASTPFMATLFRSLPSDARRHFTQPSQNTELDSDGLVLVASPNAVSLQISHMNPQQKNALWQCVLSRHAQEATGAVANAYKALQTLEQTGTAFFLPPGSPTGKAAPKILTYAPKRALRATYPWFAPKGEIKRVPPTPGDYAPNGSPLPLSDPAEAAGAQTLQRLCNAKDGTTASFVVDPALAAKTVLVVLPPQTEGGEKTEAMQDSVFRAAGAVYGLRVLREQNGTLHLTRNHVLTAKELGGINNVVLTAYPAPLLRAFRSASEIADAEIVTNYRKNRENDPNYQSNPNTKSDPKKLNREEQIMTKGIGRNTAQLALCYAALHRFRVLTEPRLVGGKSVLFSDLDEETRRCMVLALAASCIKNVDALREDLPMPTREQFEKAFVIGVTPPVDAGGAVPVEQKGARRVTFFITLPSDDKNAPGHHYTAGFLTFPAKP